MRGICGRLWWWKDVSLRNCLSGSHVITPAKHRERAVQIDRPTYTQYSPDRQNLHSKRFFARKCYYRHKMGRLIKVLSISIVSYISICPSHSF